MQPHSLAETARKGKKKEKKQAFVSFHQWLPFFIWIFVTCWRAFVGICFFKLSRQREWRFIHPLATLHC